MINSVVWFISLVLFEVLTGNYQVQIEHTLPKLEVLINTHQNLKSVQIYINSF